MARAAASSHGWRRRCWRCCRRPSRARTWAATARPPCTWTRRAGSTRWFCTARCTRGSRPCCARTSPAGASSRPASTAVRSAASPTCRSACAPGRWRTAASASRSPACRTASAWSRSARCPSRRARCVATSRARSRWSPPSIRMAESRSTRPAAMRPGPCMPPPAACCAAALRARADRRPAGRRAHPEARALRARRGAARSPQAAGRGGRWPVA